MNRFKNKLLYGTRNKSSSLLTLNEMNELEKSSDWRKKYIVKPKEIGRGHFSKVFLVTCETKNKSYAAKVIRRRKAGIDRLDKIRKEAEIIRRLNNKEIISVMQLFETYESFSEVVLICELAKGGSLFNLVYESNSGLNQIYVKCVVYKILLALESMHLDNIVHLDIKADNILLREPYPSTNIAICDFGLATELKKGINHKELVGTPDYMAPEVVNYEKITFNSDMWSVGVITYYMLTQSSPFMGHTKDETLMNVSKAKIVYDSIFNQIDFHSAKDFISSLCVKVPNLRLSSTSAQCHTWFENISDLNIDYPLQSQNFMDSSKSYISENDSYCPITIATSQRCQSIDICSFDINTKFMIENSETNSLIPTQSLENIFCNTIDVSKSEAVVNGTVHNNHSHKRNLSKQLTLVDEVTDELSCEQNSWNVEVDKTLHCDPWENHENQVDESQSMRTETKFHSSEKNGNSFDHYCIIPDAPIDLSINFPPISTDLKYDDRAIDNYCIISDSVVNQGIIPVSISIDLKDLQVLNVNNDSLIDNYCIIHNTLTNHSSTPLPLSIDLKENEIHKLPSNDIAMVILPKHYQMNVSHGATNANSILDQCKFDTNHMNCTDTGDGYYDIHEGSVVPEIVLWQPTADIKAQLHCSPFYLNDQKPLGIDNNNLTASVANHVVERSEINTVTLIDINSPTQLDSKKLHFDSGFSDSNSKFLTANLDEYENISNTDDTALTGKILERSISDDKESSTSYGDEDDNDLYRYKSLWTYLRFSEFCILL